MKKLIGILTVILALVLSAPALGAEAAEPRPVLSFAYSPMSGGLVSQGPGVRVRLLSADYQKYLQLIQM